MRPAPHPTVAGMASQTGRIESNIFCRVKLLTEEKV